MKSLPVTRFTTGIVFSKCDDDDDDHDCDAFIVRERQGRSQDFHSEGDTPPLPFPFPPLSFPPLPFPPPALPSPLSPPLPHDPAGGWGSAVSSPSGSGQSPADKRFLENLEHKIKHLTTTILTGFLIN